MAQPLVSDKEFIALFEKHRSTKVLADLLGCNVRSVQARRQRLEKNHGIELTSVNPNRNQPYQSIYTPETRREIQYEFDTGTVIVFSDAHYWSDNPTIAHSALLTLAKELKPIAIVANGDIFDGASVSRHDPLGWSKQPTVKEEIEACTEMLAQIQKAGKGAKRFWNIGNHDLRFSRYIAMQAPQLYGLPNTRLMDYFKEWNQAWSLRVNERTMIKHRWHNGVHATYNNILKSGMQCIVTGHLHRLTTTAWGDYTGRKWGVDTGTLSEPLGDQFEYLENNPTPWCSGFAVLTYKNGMLLPPELVEVIDGVAYFRGKAI